MSRSQFALLKQRRFAALFYTQFLGAFNDNVFKQAIVLLFVYGGLMAADSINLFVNLAAGLFILPYFLFSATAGQLADKFEKAALVRIIKIAEVFIALLAGLAVYAQNVYAMLTVLFLLGVQSTFFGPLKYSILPAQLSTDELVGGNAQIEMGTFVAILLGTIAGGIIAVQAEANFLLTGFVVAVAVLGYLSSRYIPECPPTDPELKVGWNIWRESWRLIRGAQNDRTVLMSVMGISWFWLLGSVVLAQIPNLSKTFLNGGPTVVTLMLSIFTLSVAAGSLACERLSNRRVELGIVPIAALGLSIGGIDLSLAINGFDADVPREWWAFIAAVGSIRILVDIALVGFFGGLFIVPLYALIQSRTPVAWRARSIAVNNIINALFMVSGAIFAIVFLTALGMTIPDFFLIVMLMNLAVALLLVLLVPEFAVRFVVWTLTHTLCPLVSRGMANIPEKGAALLLCNHVSSIDVLLIAAAVKRPVRFVVQGSLAERTVRNFVLRSSGAIVQEGANDGMLADRLMAREIADALDAGELVCVFPEGVPTPDGRLGPFPNGLIEWLGGLKHPVIPLTLAGLSAGIFSPQKSSGYMPLRRRVSLVASACIAPEELTVEGLRGQMESALG